MRSRIESKIAAAALSVLLCFAACTTPTQVVNPNIFYRRDIQLDVNGVTGSGVLVAIPASKYTIKGVSYGVMDLVTLTTCHREVVLEDQGDHFEYAFTPMPGIEDVGACGMQLGGYDKKHGRHTWGKIEFKGPDATLEATLTCNGSKSIVSGTSICQGLHGTEQWIEFNVPVKNAPDLAIGCGMAASTDGKKFVFQLNIGECIFAFVSEDKKVHRLTTLGYESILLKGD